jgi:hypothetical protein
MWGRRAAGPGLAAWRRSLWLRTTYGYAPPGYAAPASGYAAPGYAAPVCGTWLRSTWLRSTAVYAAPGYAAPGYAAPAAPGGVRWRHRRIDSNPLRARSQRRRQPAGAAAPGGSPRRGTVHLAPPQDGLADAQQRPDARRQARDRYDCYRFALGQSGSILIRRAVSPSAQSASRKPLMTGYGPPVSSSAVTRCSNVAAARLPGRAC